MTGAAGCGHTGFKLQETTMSIVLYLLIGLGCFVLSMPLVNAAIARSERRAERRARMRRRLSRVS